MDPALAKLLWLVGFIGVGVGMVLIMLRLDNSREWDRAHIAQLFLNRHGGFDLAAVMLWIAMAVNIFVIIFCLFKGEVPAVLDTLMAAFNLTFGAPTVAKIFKGSVTGEPVVRDEP